MKLKEGRNINVGMKDKRRNDWWKKGIKKRWDWREKELRKEGIMRGMR